MPRRRPKTRSERLATWYRKAKAGWQRGVAHFSARTLRIVGLVTLALIAGGIGYALAPRSISPPPKPQITQQAPQPAAPTPSVKPLAPPQHATTTPSGPPPRPATQPAWLRYAVATPPIEAGKPLIAIVIDDMGLDRPRSMRTLDLPAPLTLSYLPYAKELATQTALARLRGHELMVHIPMEPSGSADPGPNALKISMDEQELRRRLQEALSQFDGFVGVNNHMGSRFTATRASMEVVLSELKKRGLLFLDSRTTAQSLGAQIAGEMGVPTVSRNVFLDDNMSSDNVVHQLAEVERISRKQGYAVAIGHPHDNTIAALANWLPHLRERGFIVVPLTTIVARQRGAG
ncbi:MAG: divergent polysaccharide deacetylase family protein [Rhodospirillales bacterium]